MLEFLNAWGDGDARRIAKFRELASQIKNGGLKKDLLKDLDKFRNDSFLQTGLRRAEKSTGLVVTLEGKL